MIRLGLVVLLLGASVAWPCAPYSIIIGRPNSVSVPENAPALGIMYYWQRPLSIDLGARDGGLVTLTRDAGEPFWPIQEFPVAPGQLVRGERYWWYWNQLNTSWFFDVSAAAPLPTTRPRLRLLSDRFPLMQCETQWTNAVSVDVLTDAEWAPWGGLLDARFETASGLQSPVVPFGPKWHSSLGNGEVGVVCGGGPTWAKLHLRVIGTETEFVSDPLWFRCNCGPSMSSNPPCVPLASSADGGFIELADAGVLDAGAVFSNDAGEVADAGVLQTDAGEVFDAGAPLNDAGEVADAGLVSDAGPDATPPPRGCGCSSMPLGFMLLVLALAPLLRRGRSVAA